MCSRILAAALLISATAWAEPGNDALDAALARERDASVRVNYHEIETAIAERDIATARIIQDTASKQWNQAIRERHSDAAGTWAQRHAEGMRDERDAGQRATYHRRERDQANHDLQASRDDVRRLERVARARR